MKERMDNIFLHARSPLVSQFVQSSITLYRFSRTHPLRSSRRFVALIRLKEGEDPKWMDRRRLLTKIQNIRELN